MAFTPAESEGSGIVTNEGYAFAGIAWPRAEVTSFDPVAFTSSAFCAPHGFPKQSPL